VSHVLGTDATSGRRFLLLALLGGLGLAVFTAWLGFGIGGLKTTVAVDDIGEGVASLAAALACGWAAARASDRRRLGWGLLAAAGLSWTAGEAAWTFYEVFRGQAVPFPSVADLGFLMAVPFGVAGLLVLPHAPDRAATRARSILDGAIIALSLLFVVWVFVLGPVYAASGSSPVEQLLGLAYPAGDVVTASVVLIIAGRAQGPDRFRFLLLLGGFLANAVADSAFAYLTGAGIYTERGSVFDAAWVAGFGMIALAALWPDGLSWSVEEGSMRSWQVALPGAAFAAAAASAFVLAVTGHALATDLTVLMAGVGLLLVCSHLLSLGDAADLRRANSIAEAMLRRLEAAPAEGPVRAIGSRDRDRNPVFDRLREDPGRPASA
jgi:hypothetical protein